MPQQIELTWIADYWDGAVAGLAISAGEAGWFQAIWDEASDRWTDNPRRYNFHQLTADELLSEQRCHRDFERLVGTHLCWHLPLEERQVRPSQTHLMFYERYPPNGQEPDAPRCGDRPMLFTFTDRDLLPEESVSTPTSNDPG